MMNIPTFQKTVLSVFIVILIICLIIIGYLLYYHRLSEKYPPVVGSCPDYWEDVTADESKNGVSCKYLGINPNAEVYSDWKSSIGKNTAFTSSYWRGELGICHKAAWARKNNIVWDGVTNTNTKCNM